jgi:hypothetical protein
MMTAAAAGRDRRRRYSGRMGRIADRVVALLAAGPLDPRAIGRELRRTGATRARDPAAAVRRAARGDPRILRLPDGRLASLDQALRGLALTTVVDDAALAAGAVEVEPDLSPLALLGLEPALRLPRGARAGDTVLARVEDAARRRIALSVVPPPPPRADHERALVDAVLARLPPLGADDPLAGPPVTHVGTVVAEVAAARPAVLRAPGRPLSRALADAGLEVHLGWVGRAGTRWGSLTEEEADALAADVADLLRAERTAAAAAAQARLVRLLSRHRPDRLPAARRHLARVLARGGRAHEALGVLRPALAGGDAEDWYEAALIAQRSGDEVRARRWAESGLARARPGGDAAACLADLAGDLDAQAAFLRSRPAVGALGADADAAAVRRAARALVAPSRSYLVEGLAEDLAEGVPPGALPALIDALAVAGGDGRDALLALSVVLPPEAAAAAGEAAGRGARARRSAVAGLLGARPAAAWSTSPSDAPDQQQLVVTIAKEEGRVSPLVALIDLEDLGGAVKDAFFLPDMAAPRLRRELLAPMEEMGLAPMPVDLGEAVALLGVALALSDRIRWRLPSQRHQPVRERMDRWLLRPRGDAGRRPVA